MKPSELEAALQAASSTKWLGRALEVHPSLGSTQDRARELARLGCPDGQVVWALEQTAGRGRLARPWVSPSGSGLWFSLVLRPHLAPAAAAFIAIVTGVGVAEALRPLAPGIGLKWPNDLLLDGRKLGGILVEAETKDQAVIDLVVGIGINLSPGPGGWDEAIADSAASLSEACDHEPVGVLGAILTALETAYEELQSDGPDPARRRWLELSATIGREVSWAGPAGVLRGEAVDLDRSGALIIATGGERVPIGWGEIVHTA